jgi:hypothetical protein
MRVLLFSPFSGIWRHTILESQLISALETSNTMEILSVGCDGLFPTNCTVRDYFRGGAPYTSEKSIESCNRCKESRNIFVSKTKAQTLNLLDFSNQKQLYEVEKFVSRLTNANLEQVHFGEVDVGKKALYEIILKYKKRSTVLNNEEFNEWKMLVSNEALTVYPANKILSTVKPDAVIIYNAQYGVPGVFADISLKFGIKTYTISGSSSPVEAATALKIWDWKEYKAENPSKLEWINHNQNLKINGRDRKRIARHNKYILSGKSPWTYSRGKSNQNPYEFFGIDKKAKIILAVINSEDEIYAARIAGVFSESRTISEVFSTQVEWIEFLLKIFSEKQEVHLIVRLHPREFPNKRETQLSEQAMIWMQLLDSLPQNIHLDTPELGFSIYDYFSYIQALTTGWSSTALEALSHGIPVVTYDKNLLGYPHEEILTGTTKVEYKDNLGIAESLQRKNTRRIFFTQWVTFSEFHGSIFLGGGLQDAHLRTSNPMLRITLRIMNKIIKRVFPTKIKELDLKIPRSTKDDRKVIEMLTQKKDNLYQI